jgi:hypothetical protein
MTQNKSRKWLGWDLSIVVIAFGLVACGRMLATDALNSMQIKQVTKPSGADCSAPQSPTGTHLSTGILDLALPDAFAPTYRLPAYRIAAVVANNLDPYGGSPATEMNNMRLTHFTVELSAPNVQWSDACPATFDTQTFSDTILPGTTVGETFDVITPSHSLCIQPYVPAEHLVVTVKVTAKGGHGGTSIKSAAFVFTVDVCAGCLQQGYTDPALVAYEYPADYPLCAALTSSNPYTGDPCLPPGQDVKILCCGLTTTVDGVSQNVAKCPGVFTGSTATATTTATGP